MYYKEKEIYDNYYGPILEKRGRLLPAYDVMRFNASLVLGNSHPALGLAGALPHSYRPVAGFHVQPAPPPLPAVSPVRSIAPYARDATTANNARHSCRSYKR